MMCDCKDDNTVPFGAVDKSEGKSIHENPTGIGATRRPRLWKCESASRRFFHCGGESRS